MLTPLLSFCFMLPRLSGGRTLTFSLLDLIMWGRAAKVPTGGNEPCTFLAFLQSRLPEGSGLPQEEACLPLGP